MPTDVVLCVWCVCCVRACRNSDKTGLPELEHDLATILLALKERLNINYENTRTLLFGFRTYTENKDTDALALSACCICISHNDGAEISGIRAVLTSVADKPPKFTVVSNPITGEEQNVNDK